MMRGGASLDSDQAWWQLLEERQDVAPLQLTANDRLPSSINAMHLKDRLGDVVWLLRIVGALSSTHIHGTRVPGRGAVHSINTGHRPAAGRQTHLVRWIQIRTD